MRPSTGVGRLSGCGKQAGPLFALYAAVILPEQLERNLRVGAVGVDGDGQPLGLAIPEEHNGVQPPAASAGS